MSGKSVRNAAYLVSALGVVLHVYLTFMHSTSGSFFHLVVPLMNVIPYLACLVMAATIRKPIMPLCAGLIIVLIDLYMFQEYFLSSRTYRFVMIEIYQIMLKTAVVLPVGCFIGFMIDKLMKHDAEKTI